MPELDAVREVINDWALLVVALFGVVAAWEKAKRQIGRWWSNLNIWGRVHRLEDDIGELHSMAHVHNREARP